MGYNKNVQNSKTSHLFKEGTLIPKLSNLLRYFDSGI